jgi:hypothetical protein
LILIINHTCLQNIYEISNQRYIDLQNCGSIEWQDEEEFKEDGTVDQLLDLN